MTPTTEGNDILPTDSRGRVRISTQRRQALLEEFDKSGMTMTAFARFAGINFTTLAGWIQRRRRARAEGLPVNKSADSTQDGLHPGTVRFVEAMLENGDRAEVTPNTPALTLELPGGARVQVHSQLQLRLAAELLVFLGQSNRRPC